MPFPVDKKQSFLTQPARYAAAASTRIPPTDGIKIIDMMINDK